MKQPAIYIIASQRNGTIYTGVTSNLQKRIYEHKHKLIKGFSKAHNCQLLVYYEIHESMELAILREKQIKSGSRKKKLKLIEDMNPKWNDLYETLF
jgi:putative endonuclease